MNRMIITKAFINLSLVLMLTAYATQPALAQFGKLKEKISGKKKEEGDNAKGSKGSKWDKTVFLGDPVNDPVLNEDYRYSDEKKDEDGISGYYYGYWPLTGKVERVWLRYNNYKYRSESRYVRYSDDRQAAASVYSKELSDYDADRYVAYKFLEYPSDRLMLEKTGIAAREGFWGIKPGVMIFNLPVTFARSSEADKPFSFKFHLDTIAKYGKRSIDLYQPSDFSFYQKIMNNEPTQQFVIIAKNRKDLQDFNNYDTLKARVELVAQKDREMYNNFRMAVMEKPKATKAGELYTQKKWYSQAKEGMKKSTNLASGETVLYGFAVENMSWTTVTNTLGIPQYQYTNYYFVCKRNPNRQNTLSDYFLLPAVMKRRYTGGGNYGEVYFDGATFGSIDITKGEADGYKAFEPK